MSNEINEPNGIPTLDLNFCKHCIRVDGQKNIVDLFSVPRDRDTPEGVIFLHFGMTQPRLFPNGEENPAIEEPGIGGVVYPYRYEDETVTRKSAEELAAEREALRIANLPTEVRRMRDRLLLESDWTDLPHAPLSEGKRTAWQAYRQALRDVTEQAGFPEDVVWPVKPE
jgi:hypothetical protein